MVKGVVCTYMYQRSLHVEDGRPEDTFSIKIGYIKDNYGA